GQLVEGDAGFDPRPPLRRVHLENAVQVLRRVELKAGADRLPSLRRATASCSDRYAVLARDVDRTRDIVRRARNDNAERLDLINARVGRVERARHGVEPDLAGNPSRELALESLLVHVSKS